MLSNFYCEYAAVANEIKAFALQMNWLGLIFTKEVPAYLPTDGDWLNKK